MTKKTVKERLEIRKKRMGGGAGEFVGIEQRPNQTVTAGCNNFLNERDGPSLRADSPQGRPKLQTYDFEQFYLFNLERVR